MWGINREDAGDIFKEFFEGQLEKARVAERNIEAQVLKARADSLLRERAEYRRRILKEEWIDDRLLKKSKEYANQVENEERAFAYQLVHGLSLRINDEGDRYTYLFHPKTRPGGKVLGPYEVTLRHVEGGDFRVHSYILPKVGDVDFHPGKRMFNQSDSKNYLVKREKNKDDVVDVNLLEREHLMGKERGVGRFVQACSSYLSAYVYRMNQVTEMLDRYGEEELEDVQYSYNITKLKFTLAMETMAAEDQDGGESGSSRASRAFKIALKLDYDVDKIRPRPGSLVVKFVSGMEKLDEEMMQTFLDQCQSFYDEDLAQAIHVAFHR